MKDTETTSQSGVVLSGGGADGAYGVGVLKALMTGRSPATGPGTESPAAAGTGELPRKRTNGAYPVLRPEVFTGTSIGSFNAAFLASHWDRLGTASIAELETCWLERLAENGGGNGAFRVRCNPLDLADPRGYVPNPLAPALSLARDAGSLGWQAAQRLVHFATARDEALVRRAVELFDFTAMVDPEPWYQTIRDEIDFPAIRSEDRHLRISAVNWETGALRSFANAEMGDELGPLAIAASSALPGFYPPVEVGSQLYVDGGVLENAPLTPAIRAGAGVIHLVYLDPRIENIALDRLGNTMETLYRMQQISWAAAVNADLAAARRINWHKQALSAGGESASGELAEYYAKRRLLTIHRHVPNEDFGGALGLLNLERDRLQRLIDQGFRDAGNHDCTEAGCVLP